MVRFLLWVTAMTNLRQIRRELAILLRRRQEGTLSMAERVQLDVCLTRLDVELRLQQEADAGYRPVGIAA